AADGDHRGALKNRGHHRVTCTQRRLNPTPPQALDRCSAGANKDEINVQAMPLKSTDLFSHPNPGHAGADGGIGDADFLSYRCGAVHRCEKETEYCEYR